MRESEFGLMKEMMKKLVAALEDKAGSDLINISFRPSDKEITHMPEINSISTLSNAKKDVKGAIG